jgi:hypothetical protein
VYTLCVHTVTKGVIITLDVYDQLPNVYTVCVHIVSKCVIIMLVIDHTCKGEVRYMSDGV